MPTIKFTYPGTINRQTWVFSQGDVEAVAKTLREIGMRHVVIEEDA